MRYSQPNENGVFPTHECVDWITHETRSGAWVEIQLAFTEKGWASALGFRLRECGRLSLVTANGPWHKTRSDAVNEQIKELQMILAEKIEYRHTSDRQRSECQEILDWAQQQSQVELF